ncbi:reverse transcriptase domain-containing protein [Tanacetum coccineum]
MPFIEALAHMPKYAKYLKSLLTNKTRLKEACTVAMNERCLALLLNKLPSKAKDPGSCTIPCQISNLKFDNALADLGADMLEDSKVGDDEVVFDMDQSVKRPPSEDDECYGIDDLDETINLKTHELLEDDQLDAFPLKSLEIEDYNLTYIYEINSIRRKCLLLHVLEKHKGAIAWKMSDIKGVSPSFCTHKILMEDDFKPVIQPQRHLNPKVQDKVNGEIVKLLDSGLIYPISDSPWDSIEDFKKAFNILKEKLTTAPIIISPDWNIPFELICDASDFAVGAVLGKRVDGNFKPIYYASKTLNKAQEHYTTTKKELLAYLFSKPDAKPRLIRWVLLLQGFNIEIRDKKGAENFAADHLSRLENPNIEVLDENKIADEFPDEHLMMLKAEMKNREPCDNIMRRCEAGNEITEILAHYHSGPTRGHHSASITGKKVYEAGFYWPTIFSDAKDYIEVTNRAIKRILERSVGYNPRDWSKKLDDTLWAFRTAFKTPTGCTPFRLVYAKACHLPVEIEHKAYWAVKQCNLDLTLAGKDRLMQLNELSELRDGAYKNTKIYKERTKKWHDSRIRGDKNFKVGDKVLLYNSCLKMYPGKLKSKWYGPNIVKTVYPYEAIEITDKNGVSFKVNGHRLKKYYDDEFNKIELVLVELGELA